MTLAAALLIGLIIAVAVLAASWIAGDVWIRKNIPLPEDFHRKARATARPQARERSEHGAEDEKETGHNGEAAMIAEFERIRKIHELKRKPPSRQGARPIAAAQDADPVSFDDCA